MNARIIIGANYGDEGKGTVVAHYTKTSNNVLNVLTNGGAQRGHSIVTDKGSHTFCHFGSGTYHGADNYYSRYFILNPMKFVTEYNSLVVKPKNIYRDPRCRWSTPFDSMANYMEQELMEIQGSCRMGIWNTLTRYMNTECLSFSDFIKSENREEYLINIRKWYDRRLEISDEFKNIWYSDQFIRHFILDCEFMYDHTKVANIGSLKYENLIFENGQGLMLRDRGINEYDRTPSDTGSRYARQILGDEFDLNSISELSVHYVTRPYATRHGEGLLPYEEDRGDISSSIREDRTNHYNIGQGEFRYGHLDLEELHKRINLDSSLFPYQIELTHCDEMDRVAEFKKVFDTVNTYDSPNVDI